MVTDVKNLTTTVKQHVRLLASAGSAYHGLLLQHGEEFLGRTRASTVRTAAKWKDRIRPRWHQCFANAGEFCVAHPKAAYWEGYWWCGLTEGPVLHAWVVLDGHLIDFTGEDVDRRARRQAVQLLPPAQNEYLGVPVPTDFVRQRAEKTRLWGPVSEAYLSDQNEV